MAKNILIVEDEEDIAELLRFNLVKNGYHVDAVGDGDAGVAWAKHQFPHLILLDLMLPGMDGLEVCRQLKMDPATHAIPIIILSAKGEEADIVAGLELGADDYVTKPFSPRVLLARMKSVLRRTAPVAQKGINSGVIHVGKMTIFPDRRELRLGTELIPLTYSEFQTLLLLATQPGRVFTRYQIVSEVHGDDYAVTDRTIDVLMVGLRKKLGDAAEYLETIRGVGYRLKDAVDA